MIQPKWFCVAILLVALSCLVEQPAVRGESETLKMTVANVRGEVAVLFTMSPAGKLKFVRKLAHGDAVDLDTTAGVRWVAVFAGDTPGSEEFTITAADKKWILRAPE